MRATRIDEAGTSASAPAATAPGRVPDTWSMVSQARASLRAAQGSALAPTLAVSLHDVAPATWPACQRVLAAIDAVAARAAVRVPVALLVVPRFRGVDSARDAQFIGAVEARLAQGDEAVLHGWTHVDDQPLRRPFDLLRRRVYTAGEGEFAALDRMEALRRVHAGVGWFAARGWPLRGFVAPAWLMSRGARAALADTPLAYAGTRRELLLLAAGDRLFAPSMCWSTRSAWRRALSSPVNALLAGLNARRPLLRLALHPSDADHPRVRRSWQAALLAALATRRACTEGEVADRWIGSDWSEVDTETLEDIEEPLAASVDTTPTLAEAVSAHLPTVSEDGQASSVLRPA